MITVHTSKKWCPTKFFLSPQMCRHRLYFRPFVLLKNLSEIRFIYQNKFISEQLPVASYKASVTTCGEC
jgi:hypothetical protein